jgi:hypothetical protein
MSNLSTTSIHIVGPYHPARRLQPRPATPPYITLPPVSVPLVPPVPRMPLYPPMPSYPPVGSFPAYPARPSYPSRPTFPTQPGYPSNPPQQSFPNNPPQPYPLNPQRGIGAFLGDVWSGVKERSHEIGQFVLHPFNEYARRPYVGRNPHQPRTSGEITGRWLVNSVLIVGAFLGGRALVGAGGGAGVGQSGFLGRVAQVVAAPFQWAARGIGNVLGAVKDLIGGALSGLFGGARVGFG